MRILADKRSDFSIKKGIIMKNNKVLVTLMVCITLILVSAIGAFSYVSIQKQANQKEQTEQARKDKLFSDCMERTKTETVGISAKTWINKDGDENHCRKQVD
jgi:flagellar basal body-associated protein FliL